MSIITYSKNNCKLSPCPLPNWTYPVEIYKSLKEMYPTAYDKSNRTWLLELIIIDRFLYGRTEIQLAHDYVMSICGRGKRYSGELIEAARLNLNGLFELYNYSDVIEEELISIYGEEYLEEIDWNNQGYTYRKTKGYHELEGSRVGLYVPNNPFELAKEKYVNIKYIDSDRAYILTGSIKGEKSIRTIRKYIEEYATNQNKYYKEKATLPEIVELVELVNKLVNNKAHTKLKKDNAPLVLDWLIECRDNNTGVCEDFNDNKEKINKLYNHHKNTVEKLLDTPLHIYRIPKPSSPRIFDGIDQCLAREVRSKIYPESCGCFDLDLCRSQLAIIASLSGCPELAKWLEIDSLWDEIRLDTGVSKWIAKPCLYTYCFGGNANTWYKEGYIDKEYAQELKDHPLFKALLRAGKALREQIEDSGFIELKEGHRLYLDDNFNSRQALATKIQYIESMIIKSVIQYISEQEGKMNLLGVYHDGVLIRVRPKTKNIRKHLATINEIAKDKGLSFGIKNVSLDYK